MHEVDRHLNGEIHQLATAFELREKPSNIQELSAKHKTQEKEIQKCITSSAESAYLKLMGTAYEVALAPSIPHKHFEVLVKC